MAELEASIFERDQRGGQSWPESESDFDYSYPAASKTPGPTGTTSPNADEEFFAVTESSVHWRPKPSELERLIINRVAAGST